MSLVEKLRKAEVESIRAQVKVIEVAIQDPEFSALTLMTAKRQAEELLARIELAKGAWS